jgi:hypothetical protein
MRPSLPPSKLLRPAWLPDNFGTMVVWLPKFDFMKHLAFLFILLLPSLLLAQGYRTIQQSAVQFMPASGTMPAFSITGTGGIPGSNIIGAVGSAATSGTANISLDYEANTFATAMDQGVDTTDSPTFLDGSYASLFNGSGGNVANAASAGNGGLLYYFSGHIQTDVAGDIYYASTGGLLVDSSGNLYYSNGNELADYGGPSGAYVGLHYPGGALLGDYNNNLYYGNGSGVPIADGSGNLYYSNGDELADAGGNLWLNNAFNATPIVPTGSLVIYDSTGTAYLIPAVPR